MSATRARPWRAPYLERVAEDRARLWRFRRAVARVAVVDGVVADYATSYCGRPFRRREIAPLESAVEAPGVVWSIDGDVMAEFHAPERGPARLVVHEIALLAPLKKRLRTRHVRVEYARYLAG